MNIGEVNALQSIEDVRKAATEMGVTYSGNSGMNSLKKKIIEKLNEKDNQELNNLVAPTTETVKPVVPEPVKNIIKRQPHMGELALMDPNKITDISLRRAVVRARCMKLTRIRITNLNPNDSALQGDLLTVQNKYVKVTRFIPYHTPGEDNEGYHVEQIILDHLKNQKFAMRKEIKNNKIGVKQYKTVLTPKYSIEILPPLTKEELKNLADHQAASSN